MVAGASPNYGACVVLNAESGEAMYVDPSDAGKGGYPLLRTWFNSASFTFAIPRGSSGTLLVSSYAGRAACAGDDGYLQLVSSAEYWTLTAVGSTLEHDGETLDLYTLTAPDGRILSSTTGDGGRLRLVAASGASSPSCQWAFWEAPLFSSGGLYEIRSKQDPTMCAQIQSDSNSTGAQLVMGYADGSNGDKFWFMGRDGGGYSIIGARSGLALSVQASTATNGAYITQQNPSTTYDNQKWAVTEVATGVYGGMSATEVEIGSYLAADPTTYVVDDYQKDTTANARISMYERNGGDNQRWLLVPTTLSGGSIPIPANVGMTAAVGDYPAQYELEAESTVYPCWDCTDGWATGLPNHFEWSYEINSLGADGRWSTWRWPNGYDNWQTVAAHYDGTRVWKADGVTLPSGDAWVHQMNFYVRCVSQAEVWKWWDGEVTSSLEPAVGPQSGARLTVYRVPTVTLLAAGVTPAGLRIEYQSDYDIGRTNIFVKSISGGGKEWLQGGEIEFLSVDEQGSIFIPCERCAGLAGGTPITVTYQIGTDQRRLMDATLTADLTAAYVSGWDSEYSESVAKPTVEFDYATRSIVATMQHVGTERLWRQTPTKTTEVTGTTADGVTTFRTKYVYGTSGLALLTTAYDPTEDKWGTYRLEVGGEGSAFELQYPPCHVWEWDGGSFLVEANEDPLETTRTLEAVYEEHILNKRARSVVTFAETVRSEFSVDGLLYTGVTQSTVDDLLALTRQKHVRYYAPSGEEATVAVTGATYSRHRRYARVTITMIEESL